MGGREAERDLLPTVIIGTTIFGYRDDGVVSPQVSAWTCVNIRERNTTCAYRKQTANAVCAGIM